METFIQEINQNIKDIFENNIVTTKAINVPSRDDSGLTFSSGTDKRGKLLNTCILMVDIRNSTKISRDLKNDKEKLGKIYTSFVYSMTRIADEYGYVRNIIGDRVMVVFEPGNCFIDAINCAALMNAVGNRILKKHASVNDFRIGIGIEFGEMLVLKTGISKKHEERSEYKNLVWIGDAANVASKLCDLANKNYSFPIFKVTYEYKTRERNRSAIQPDWMNPLSFLENQGLFGDSIDVGFSYKTYSDSKSMDYIEFAKSINIGPNGWRYNYYKVIGFDIEKRAGTSEPILLSSKVFREFKLADPKSPYLAKLTLKSYPDLPGLSSIYGGSFIPESFTKIKI